MGYHIKGNNNKHDYVNEGIIKCKIEKSKYLEYRFKM